jgi:hypothetical protein
VGAREARQWSSGVMECWSNAVMKTSIPLLHYSITQFLPITPPLHSHCLPC